MIDKSIIKITRTPMHSQKIGEWAKINERNNLKGMWIEKQKNHLRTLDKKNIEKE